MIRDVKVKTKTISLIKSSILYVHTYIKYDISLHAPISFPALVCAGFK